MSVRHELVQAGVRYLSISGAMREAGVSKRTIYYWIKSGFVKVVTGPGGKQWIVASSLAMKESEMSVPSDQVERAKAQARVRESQGYFAKAKAGDQKAASLFVRLVACDLNPNGVSADWGWLSKTPGEAQVDGFAEDAICWTANPGNRENAVDLINGAGAPNASIGGDVKPRRENNLWVKPVPLSKEQMAYLTAGTQPGQPPPAQFPYPDEGTAVLDFEQRVEQAYKAAHRKFPDEHDADAFRHFARYGYSCHEMPEPDAANKHIKELREELGAPPE